METAGPFDALINTEEDVRRYGRLKVIDASARRNVVSEGQMRFADYIDVVKRMRCVTEQGNIEPYNPWEMQKEIIIAFLSIRAPFILGDDFEDDYLNMAQLYGWPKRYRDSLWITSGRKVGKSYTSAAIIAADMIASRQVKVFVSSLTLDNATDFANNVKIFIELHPDFETKIKPYYRATSDAITIRYPDKRVTRLKCGTKNARGFVADVMVLDESAYADKETILGTMIPLLKNRGKCMLCISTPKRGPNVHRDATKMLDASGENRYYTKELLPICKACSNGPHPELCAHGAVGDVQDREKTEEYRPLYAKVGNLKMFEQEMYGIDADNLEERPWYASLLNEFFDESNFIENIDPKLIEYGIIGVDTPGGGNMGRLAMNFTVRLLGGAYVVSHSSLSTNGISTLLSILAMASSGKSSISSSVYRCSMSSTSRPV